MTPVVGDERELPESQEIFSKLTYEQQREILGQGKFALWRSGSITLDDLVSERESDAFGIIRFETPLRELMPPEI